MRDKTVSVDAWRRYPYNPSPIGMAVTGKIVSQNEKMQSIAFRKSRVKAQKRYFKLLKYQSFVLALCCVLILFFDFVAAYSALLGGLLYLIPNAWHAWKHFNTPSAESPNRALAELYAGQIWKMALMASLFALIFVLVEPLSGFSLFVVLLLMQVSHLVLQISAAKN
ncbi:MAG TPA: ATP synthase subunit I [Marinobacterium sp.]|nr:ATP synthase subunit I [Marinobacterium sp.]